MSNAYIAKADSKNILRVSGTSISDATSNTELMLNAQERMDDLIVWKAAGKTIEVDWDRHCRYTKCDDCNLVDANFVCQAPR